MNHHSLRYWLMILVDKSENETWPKARQSVEILGTNAVPYCVACLLSVERTNAPSSLSSVRDDDTYRLAAGAAKALELLGEEAKPAIPALRKLIHSADPSAVHLGAAVLARLGRDGAEILITGITNQNPVARSVVVNELARAGTNLLPHVSFLLENLGCLDRDTATHCCSAVIICVGSHTNLTPPFVSLLSSQNPNVVYGEILGLSCLGTNEPQVVRTLEGLMNASDDGIASAAAEAIRVISAKSGHGKNLHYER